MFEANNAIFRADPGLGVLERPTLGKTLRDPARRASSTG
jgi:hypothetical protein